MEAIFSLRSLFIVLISCWFSIAILNCQKAIADFLTGFDDSWGLLMVSVEILKFEIRKWSQTFDFDARSARFAMTFSSNAVAWQTLQMLPWMNMINTVWEAYFSSWNSPIVGGIHHFWPSPNVSYGTVRKMSKGQGRRRNPHKLCKPKARSLSCEFTRI